MNWFFYSQPVITFTTARPKLTTKRAAQTANTLYMEFIKQWLTLNSLAAFSIKLLWQWLCLCTFMCMHVQGAIFFVVQHWMNISISWQLTACLSSTPQPSADLQQHNYHYPAIPLLSPPFSLTFPLPLSPCAFLNPTSLPFSFTFCFRPLSSLCHWSLMRLAASMLSNDLHW